MMKPNRCHHRAAAVARASAALAAAEAASAQRLLPARLHVVGLVLRAA
jgi:hypothetical protein